MTDGDHGSWVQACQRFPEPPTTAALRCVLVRILVMLGVVFAAITVASPHAKAQRGQADWYGWQVMVSDAAALTSVTVAGKLDGWPADGLAVAGTALFALGGPVVHLVQQRDLGVAGSSFAVRMFGALFTGITLMGPGDSSTKLPLGRKLLATAIAVAALAIDWFIFSEPEYGNGPGTGGVTARWAF